MTARFWFFTASVELCPSPPKWCATSMRHLIYQKERGEQQDYVHWQGCVSFSQSMRLTGAQLALGLTGAHMEATKSKKAIDYCCKEQTRMEGPFEFGARVTQGQRTDLSMVPTWIQEGKDDTWFMMNQLPIYTRLHRILPRMRRRLIPGKIKRPGYNLTILWGDSGSGKTWEAHNRFPNSYEWSTGVEFNDYEDETSIFIDEFDKIDFTKYKWDYWLRLFDKYPFTARILYGTIPIKAETYIITMNQDPKDLFAGVGWQRRLEEATVIHWESWMRVDFLQNGAQNVQNNVESIA